MWLQYVLLERYSAAESFKMLPYRQNNSLNSTDIQCTKVEEEISETKVIQLKTKTDLHG